MTADALHAHPMGSLPRAREIPRVEHGFADDRRVTPAGAGNTRHRNRACAGSWGHSRGRGKYGDVGSPRLRLRGVTPAGAGNTQHGPIGRRAGPGHSRGRGKYLTVPNPGCDCDGSLPRAREILLLTCDVTSLRPKSASVAFGALVGGRCNLRSEPPFRVAPAAWCAMDAALLPAGRVRIWCRGPLAFACRARFSRPQHEIDAFEVHGLPIVTVDAEAEPLLIALGLDHDRAAASDPFHDALP